MMDKENDLKNQTDLPDKVLTLDNWWDGPLYGLCTFCGEFCIFEHAFSEELDDYTDFYYLTPITEADAQKILENWHRWCRFMGSGGNAFDWKNDVDILEISERSEHYRKFKKRAVFSGVFPASGSEEFNDIFVEWI